MKAKEYLNKLKKYDFIIKSKAEEVKRWHDIATNITIRQEGERVQSSGDKDKLGASVSIYVDLEEELLQDIQLFEKARREIIDTLTDVLNGEEYSVCYQHFVIGLDWQAIADNMGKSYRWATSVNGNALAKIQRFLDGN